MTVIYPYNTRTNRIDGASFPVYFSSAMKNGVAELVEGYEFSSSSSLSSVSSSSSESSVSSSSVSSSSESSLSSSCSSESSVSSSSSSTSGSSMSSQSSLSSSSTSSSILACDCESHHLFYQENINAEPSMSSKIGTIYAGEYSRIDSADCALYLVVKRVASNAHYAWLMTNISEVYLVVQGGEAYIEPTASTIGYGSIVSAPGTIMLSNGGTVELTEAFTYDSGNGSFVKLNCVNTGTIFVSTTGNDTNDGLTSMSPKLTIQGGIDAAYDGYTVMVDAGTYNLAQTIVASKEVYIRGSGAETTIIDGGDSVRCLTLSCGAVASDMTIQHGYAPDHGGGVLVTGQAILERCIVCDNETYADSLFGGGGGISLQGAGTIKHCLIVRNISTGASGGGIVINQAQGNGGFACEYLPATVINCTICDNTSTAFGRAGGLSYIDADTTGTSEKNCIVNNIIAYNSSIDYYATGTTSLIYQNNITGTETFVNRASGNYRLQTGASSINAGSNEYAVGEQYDLDKRTRIVNYIVDVGAYEYDSLNYYYDVYASPGGNDLNDGSTVGSPKRTIQAALGVCMQGGTVHLSSGTFVLSTPVTITGNRKVNGASAALTIIDGNDATRCIDIYDGILQNATIKQGNDSGIVVHPPTTTPYFVTRISKCIVEDCYSASHGGGIQIENWTTPEPFGVIVDSCLIHHNTADASGGGIYISGTSACSIHMCTVCKNSAPLGGGIYSSSSNAGAIYNSIVRLNLLVDIYGASQPLSLMYTCYGSAVNITCTGASCGAYDPLFENETLDDFHLQSGSPCAEAGWSGDAVSPDNKDLDGNPRLYAYTYDLGAYERQS